MAKFKIKKGDKVVVLTGRDKGKTGEVVRILTEDAKVIVSGVNMLTKHRKASAAGPGGLEKIEAPLHVSNVALVDPKDNKATRVRIVREDGVRSRRSARSGQKLD